MRSAALISIILPVYNGEHFLETAIESCLNQSYRNLELIIVNDASTDNSLKIAKASQRKDDRVRIIENAFNYKLPAALNIGHRAALGDFITWTSDDNILKENFLQMLYETLLKKNCDIVYSNFDIIWQDGSFKREEKSGPSENLLFGNTVGASFLYKKEVFESLGGYDEDKFLAEDYHFFLMASLHSKLHHLNENLFQYRIHSNSLSGRIQTDKDFNLRHVKAINSMFQEIGKKLDMTLMTIDFLTNLYLAKLDSVYIYLNHKNVIVKDIQKYCRSTSVTEQECRMEKVLRDKIRRLWLNGGNLKRRDLTEVILKDYKLIFKSFKDFPMMGRLLFKNLRKK